MSDSPDYSANAADKRLVVIPLVGVTIVGVVMMVIDFLVAGGPGLLAGACATLVVLAFFGISQAILAKVLRDNPQIAMGVAMLSYVLQILFLFGVLILLKNTTLFPPKVFAISVVVCALAWMAMAIGVLVRTKVLYVEPGSGPGNAGTESS